MHIHGTAGIMKIGNNQVDRYRLYGILTHNSPLTAGRGWEGILLTSKAALPLTRRTASLWKRCLMASSSSFPVVLACALASFLICRTALACQPPSISTEARV